MITLTDGVDSIILHSDYQWIDEHDWHPVEQSVERGLTGALIVQLGTRLAGRPITLQPEDDSASWMRYSTLAVLCYHTRCGSSSDFPSSGRRDRRNAGHASRLQRRAPGRRLVPGDLAPDGSLTLQ